MDDKRKKLAELLGGPPAVKNPELRALIEERMKAGDETNSKREKLRELLSGGTMAAMDTGKVEMRKAPGAKKAEEALSTAAEFIPFVGAGKAAAEGDYGSAALQAGMDVAGGPLLKGAAALGGKFLAPALAGAIKAKRMKAVAPQDEALRIAEQKGVEILGLPPGNTPMDRAKAMGLIDAYHGTADDVVKIDPAKLGSSTGAQSAKKAFWAVSDPTTARGYAEYAATDAKVKKLIDAAEKAEKKGDWDLYDDLLRKAEALQAENVRNPLQGQNIMPLMVRANRGVRGAEMDAKGAEFVDLEGGVNKFLDQALRENKDLGVIKNLADDVGMSGRPATHFAVMNPSVVRSRFAAFDPSRIHENDLLAGIGALGIGLPALSLSTDKNYD